MYIFTLTIHKNLQHEYGEIIRTEVNLSRAKLLKHIEYFIEENKISMDNEFIEKEGHENYFAEYEKNNEIYCFEIIRHEI